MQFNQPTNRECTQTPTHTHTHAGEKQNILEPERILLLRRPNNWALHWLDAAADVGLNSCSSRGMGKNKQTVQLCFAWRPQRRTSLLDSKLFQTRNRQDLGKVSLLDRYFFRVVIGFSLKQIKSYSSLRVFKGRNMCSCDAKLWCDEPRSSSNKRTNLNIKINISTWSSPSSWTFSSSSSSRKRSHTSSTHDKLVYFWCSGVLLLLKWNTHI